MKRLVHFFVRLRTVRCNTLIGILLFLVTQPALFAQVQDVTLRMTPSLQPVAGARTNALPTDSITPGSSTVPLVARNSEPTPPPKAAPLAEAKPGQRVTALGTHRFVFIENKGQWDGRARFKLSSGGKTLWLTNSGIVFDNLRPKVEQPAPLEDTSAMPDTLRRGADPHERLVFYEDFIGAAPSLQAEPIDIQPGAYNYLIGGDSTKWHTGVRGYGGVIYRNVWEGVDFRVSGNGPNLEQEFVVRPGADVAQVQVAYRGIKDLEVAGDGSLVIHTPFGDLREAQPRIYQEIAGKRVAVKGKFKLASNTAYTFEVDDYQKQYALVVDPTLLYSTYLGGSVGATNVFPGGVTLYEYATGLAVDSSGSAYVTGFTGAPDFPVTPGADETVETGVFVTKFSPLGRL